MICIRVWRGKESSAIYSADAGFEREPYLHQVHWIHHRVFLFLLSAPLTYVSSSSNADRNACERAGQHIVSQAIICWEGFIAAKSSIPALLQKLLLKATDSYSSPGTASGLLNVGIFSAVNAAGNLADVATIANGCACPPLALDVEMTRCSKRATNGSTELLTRGRQSLRYVVEGAGD